MPCLLLRTWFFFFFSFFKTYVVHGFGESSVGKGYPLGLTANLDRLRMQRLFCLYMGGLSVPGVKFGDDYTFFLFLVWEGRSMRVVIYIY